MCLFAALVILASLGLFTAAALAPAPPTVLPLLALVCIGGPMLAAWELRSSNALLLARQRVGAGADGLDHSAVAALRRSLDRLPETQHPLGL